MFNLKRFSAIKRASKLFFSTHARMSTVTMNEKWVKAASKEMKGKDIHKTLVRETQEHIQIKPLYTHKDVETPKEEELPGFFPFKRGPYATMYTGRPWTVNL